jgi:quinoprotein glucose dehydrogenase
MRYTASAQVTRENLQHLHPVWTFHTHALDVPRSGSDHASFEATPVLAQGTLYFTTPFDVVFAIDARTGTERWSFDPKVVLKVEGGFTTSRGVALWEQLGAGPCSRRVFVGTMDARLMAVDADTGAVCMGFGAGGSVDLTRDVELQNFGMYEVTSPPTVVGNVVVVGSSVGDNQQVDAESGLVRGYDAVTGKQLWAWEPLPWARQNHPRTGAGNTWSVISADPQLGLVYLPTGSASPDYWGGLRPGDNRDADSIVALDAKTGAKVWAFQVVHHNLWDYDVAAQPLLFTWRAHTPEETPAVAVATKMGQIFVLDRRNGRPLFPIDERVVPQSDVPGELTSPTQPFSSLPPVGPLTLPTDADANGFHRNLWNRIVCKVRMHGLRYEGIYTPPSLGGSILFPGNLGGVNWGSAAYDPLTGIYYANNNRSAYIMKLVPQGSWFDTWDDDVEPALRDWRTWVFSAIGILALNILYRFALAKWKPERAPLRPWLPKLHTLFCVAVIAAIAVPVTAWPPPMSLSHFGHELSPQRKAPYEILRNPLEDSNGRPCLAPPWGAMTAINLNTGKLAWSSPLGTMVQGATTGILNFGGPLVTASGLVFTGAAEDPYLRAFDSANGTELWKAKLPATAQATPMSYMLDGRQYVVIAAGGHADRATGRGDALVAFALDAGK